MSTPHPASTEIPTYWAKPATGETAQIHWFPADFADADCAVTLRRPAENHFELRGSTDGMVDHGGFNAFAGEALQMLASMGFEPVA